MNKDTLRNEIEKICRSEGHCCAGYGCEEWPMRGTGEDIDKLEIPAVSQIPSLLEGAELPTTPHLRQLVWHSDGRIVAKSGANAPRPKRLYGGKTPSEAINKLIKDQNACLQEIKEKMQ